ncbi:hypothetical protein V1477_002249 [Vespula maculifrons]|uniref:Uncharacterized protein n=1 Tax=Vespula maculifrons TaxID=7453 RepID=A0ABD2CXD8_VESMC
MHCGSKNINIYNINFHLLCNKTIARSRLQKFLHNDMMNCLKDSTFKKKAIDKSKHQPALLISAISLIFFISISIILSNTFVIKQKCILIRKRKNKKKIIKNIAKNYENNKCPRIKY